MPRLKDLTGGKIAAGTGTVNVNNRTIGGIGLMADGTNEATIVLRENNVSGDKIFEFSSTSSIFIGIPLECTDTVYYDISGTGSGLELFEWIPYRGGRD